MIKFSPNLLKRAMLFSAVSTLTACAVNPKDVAQFKEEKTQYSEHALGQIKKQRIQETSLTVINSNYLGDSPIDLPYASTLPPNFFEPIFIRSRDQAYGTVAQAARNITIVTGVPTNVNADITAPTAVTGVASAAVSMQNVNSPVAPQVSRVVTNNLPGAVVPINFQGTLLSYVKMIASSSGVDWEFKDGAIHFFRMVTKSFVLANLNPGDIDISDSMTKGGSASTGATASGSSGGGSNSGSFSTTSQVGLKGSYSVWKSLKPAIESAMTTAGKLSINEGTGSVTITDTKAAVEKVGKIISQEDTILGKQVAIEVRILRIDLNDESQAGFDLSLAYNAIKGAKTGQFNTQLGNSAVSSSAGQLNFSVQKTNTGSTALASVQALNQFGTVVSDSTTTLMTTNRVPAMTGTFNTQGYLASTNAAPAGAAGGSGVPGLNGGSTTTGSFLRLLPTIRENNSILMNMSIDLSDLLGFGSASTGQGATLQQIQWANTSGTKTISNMLINQDEAMVMAGISGDKMGTTALNSVSGVSAKGVKSKSLFVVVVTPRILKN